VPWGAAVGLVFAGLALIIVVFLVLIIPEIVRQAGLLASAVPSLGGGSSGKTGRSSTTGRLA